jgi:hypothetical protein
MENELEVIYSKLHATHSKQIIDLAVLRILGSALLTSYSKQYGQDVTDQLALFLDLIDTRGNTTKAVTQIKQASETISYLNSLPV